MESEVVHGSEVHRSWSTDWGEDLQRRPNGVQCRRRIFLQLRIAGKGAVAQCFWCVWRPSFGNDACWSSSEKQSSYLAGPLLQRFITFTRWMIYRICPFTGHVFTICLEDLEQETAQTRRSCWKVAAWWICDVIQWSVGAIRMGEVGEEVKKLSLPEVTAPWQKLTTRKYDLDTLLVCILCILCLWTYGIAMYIYICIIYTH